jgi:lysophospholipase L1-like esterase
MIYRIIFILLFLLTACTIPTTSLTEVPSLPPIRYLALGDSYTIGESVKEHERWPNQLASLIEVAPEVAGQRVQVSIIARTGWTTQELWDGIQSQTLEPRYDLVSLLIGVNNQYRGYDIHEYREQFVFLLNKAIEYAGGDPQHVIVLSIPDWGVTPFAQGRDIQQVANQIDSFNAVNKGETEKAGAHYFDITPISREAGRDPSLLAADGLHPSGKMYAQWAQLVLPVVLKI